MSVGSVLDSPSCRFASDWGLHVFFERIRFSEREGDSISRSRVASEKSMGPKSHHSTASTPYTDCLDVPRMVESAG